MAVPKTSFELGHEAQIACLPIDQNPYDKSSAKEFWLNWRIGYLCAQAKEQGSRVHYEEGILFAPKSEFDEVKTDPKETVMGKSGQPDPFQKEEPKKRDKFLPTDKPWSKENEDADDYDSNWESEGEFWKDPKKPKDDK